MTSVLPKLATYDVYKARDQFYAEMNKIFDQTPKEMSIILDPIRQFNTITKVVLVAKNLGLEGVQFSREGIESRLMDYVTDIAVGKVILEGKSKVQTELSGIEDSYSRKKEGSPSPTQSSGQISLALMNNSKGLTPRKNGLHVIMNPINFFTDTQGLSKNLDVIEKISNDLQAYYTFIKNKPKNGFTVSLLKEFGEKYKQVAKFFYDGYSIECISFDFMFDGQAFKDHCPEGNPFDLGIMEYLNLSTEYAYMTLNFFTPKFQLVSYSPERKIEIKMKNYHLIRQNSFKNIDVLFQLLADSKQVKQLTKINLSGMMMTDAALVQLCQIIKKGKVQYLNLSGCSFSTEGIKILQECFKNGKDMEIIVLDDIIKHYFHRVSDFEAHSLLQEISLVSTNLRELHMNWNFAHVIYNTTKKTSTKDYMRDLSLQKLNMGPLGKECLDTLITIVLSKTNLRFLFIRNNVLPFEFVQSLAIALKGQRSILELDVTGNKDFFDMEGDPTCWQKIFSCKFFDKICFYKYCCACCCASSTQFGNRPVNLGVLDDIELSCFKHNNNPIYNEKHKQITNKYQIYAKEQIDVLRKEKQRQNELERQKTLREQEAQKLREAKEEKEFQQKKELLEAGASKTMNQITLNNETRSEKVNITHNTNPAVTNQSSVNIPTTMNTVGTETNRLLDQKQINIETS